MDLIINEHLARLNDVLQQTGFEPCVVDLDYRSLRREDEAEDWAPDPNDDEVRH